MLVVNITESKSPFLGGRPIHANPREELPSSAAKCSLSHRPLRAAAVVSLFLCLGLFLDWAFEVSQAAGSGSPAIARLK
jgi:hypothetical protein